VLIYNCLEIKMTNMTGCHVNTIITLRTSMVRIRENPFLLPTLFAKFMRNDLNGNMDSSVPSKKASDTIHKTQGKVNHCGIPRLIQYCRQFNSLIQGLKIPRNIISCRFDSVPRHQIISRGCSLFVFNSSNSHASSRSPILYFPLQISGLSILV
jgi:hypothetical protein